MLQVRENEIALRKCSGGAAQLRTSEGILVEIHSRTWEYSRRISCPHELDANILLGRRLWENATGALAVPEVPALQVYVCVSHQTLWGTLLCRAFYEERSNFNKVVFLPNHGIWNHHLDFLKSWWKGECTWMGFWCGWLILTEESHGMT